jgi:hypothetical protein
MGLDIYCGSLTRYIAGDWELVTQKAAREQGVAFKLVRKNEPSEDTIRDPEVIRPLVTAWRSGLSQALGANLTAPLDWDESAAAPYFTDKPAWDMYAALVLWAAYEEQPQFKRPVVHAGKWSEDPAYKASTAKGFKSKYSHLFDVILWLPCAFDFVFETKDATGNPIVVGSSVTLQRQLGELNRRSWQADEKTLATWSRDGVVYGKPLESGARFAFALFERLAGLSVAHRLPMRLDW